MQPDLSILVCTVCARTRPFLTPLLAELDRQATGKPVEILYLGDNKRMTVGMKRNHLLKMASGRYVTFVDDDDTVSPLYVERLLSGIQSKATCVVFDVEIRENGGPPKLVVYDKDFLGDRNCAERYERLPNHLMCIQAPIARYVGFGDKSFGEDAEFALRLKPMLNTQARIPETLYFYAYADQTTLTRSS